MQLIASFVLFLAALKAVESSDGKENLIRATREIIEHCFAGKSSTLNILTATDLTDRANDFISELLADSTFVIRFGNYRDIKDLGSHRRKSNIILIDSIDSFRILERRIRPKYFNLRGFYLFVLLNGEIDELEEIFRVLWRKYIYNVAAMFKDGEVVQMKTFMPFNNSCSNTSPVIVNSFSNGKFSEPHKTIFPDKFTDLVGCTMRVATYSDGFCVIARNHSEGSVDFTGIDIEFLTAIARDLNFKIEIKLSKDVSPWGTIYSNGTIDGAIGDVAHGEAEIAIGCYYLKRKRMQFVDSSIVYYTSPDVFVISPGEKLNQFEKLLQPYDRMVWVLLLVTLLVAIVVIFVLQFQSPRCQALVLGEDNRYPITNLCIAAYGGSQAKLPRKNFSRFLLIKFVLFCLIVRSAYQGSLFKFLQMEKHHKDVETISDMIDQKFDIFVHQTHLDLFEGNEKIQGRFVERDFRGFFNFVLKFVFRLKYFDSVEWVLNGNSLENSSRTAYLSSMMNVVSINKKNRNKFALTTCPEIIWNAKLVFYYQKDFYLIDTINRKMSAYAASGILSLIVNRYVDLQYFIVKPEHKGPQKLSFTHLEGAFMLWIIMIAISFVSFLTELLINRINRSYCRKRIYRVNGSR